MSGSEEAGPPLLRKMLRSLGSVELWQIEATKPRQKLLDIHYVVKKGHREHAFDRPHEAWAYFQHLTGAPNKDTRPEPPPIDEAFLGSARKTRRRLQKRKSLAS